MLGAAVADDVMGLVILTVVIRIVTEGSVSVLGVLWIVVVAIGFLVVSTAVGLRLAPPLFAAVTRHSRSSGTLVGVALAFTLGLAELADKAKLAPIVGAFVAGLVLASSQLGGAHPAGADARSVTSSSPSSSCRSASTPTSRSSPTRAVLGVAGVLLVVAVVGKLVGGGRLSGSPGDRLLVGIGMIPRGEVGLIFATIGAPQRASSARTSTPRCCSSCSSPRSSRRPLLRQRLLQLRKRRQPSRRGSARPPEGWLIEVDDQIELVAEPPPGRVLEVALEVAIRCRRAVPGASVMNWFSELPSGPLRWTRFGLERCSSSSSSRERPGRGGC